MRLLAPARFSSAGTVAVDRLRLGVDQAVLEASGQLAPALNLTASLRGLPVALADIVVPDLGLEGSIDAEARLTGSPAQPAGQSEDRLADLSPAKRSLLLQRLRARAPK